MRKFYYLYICLAAAMALILFSCVKEYLIPVGMNGEQQHGLTVTEAREFFEMQVTKARSWTNANSKPRGFSPGDFTPMWDDAITSGDDRGASVDVPLQTTYRYRALISEIRKGQAKAKAVDIVQKLVVVKGKRSDNKSIYIATIIPDAGYYEKHRNKPDKEFSNYGPKGLFSGTVIYTAADTGMPIRVDKYVNGEKRQGVFILDSSAERMAANLRRAAEIVGQVSIQRSKAGISRSFGEDDDDDASGFWEWFQYLWEHIEGDDVHYEIHYDEESQGWWVTWDADGDGIAENYSFYSDPNGGDKDPGGNDDPDDPGNPDDPDDPQIGDEEDAIRTMMLDYHYNRGDAQMYALAYALSQLDCGVALLVREFGNFNQVNAEDGEPGSGGQRNYVTSKCKNQQ